MADNYLQSPTASFASTLKAPTIASPVTQFNAPAKVTKAPAKQSGGWSFSKETDPQVPVKLFWFDTWFTVDKPNSQASEQIQELRDAKSSLEWNSLVSKAKEVNPNMFSSIDNIWYQTSIANIKLAKTKAITEAQDFLSNPSWVQATTFKKNTSPEKYKLYQEFANTYNETRDIILSWDKGYAKDFSWARWVLDLPVINTIANKTSNYEGYSSAIKDLEGEGTTWLTDWNYTAANLAGWALEFWAFSWIGRQITVNGTRALWMKVGWETGKQLIWVATKVEAMATNSPTLYAMTVDNGMSAAIQYGLDTSLGGTHSNSDFVNNLFMGAAFPVVLHWALNVISSWYKYIKGVVPKDLKNLEAAVTNDMNANGTTDVGSAMENIKDDFKFDDGTTLAAKQEEYKATTTSNPDAKVSKEEVRTTLAKNGVAASDEASRIYADTISNINKDLKGEPDATWAYGAMGSDDKLQLVKTNINNKFHESPVLNWPNAAKIIEDAFKEQGLVPPSTKNTENIIDSVDEMFHTTESKPELIQNASNLSELEEAFTWKKGTTSKSVDGLRFANDSWELKIEDLKAEADKNWVKIDSTKLYDKKEGGILNTTQKLNKDYIHKVIDEIDLKRSGYSSTKSSILSNFKLWLNKKISQVESMVRWVTWTQGKPKFGRGEGTVGRWKVDLNKLTLSEADNMSRALGETNTLGKNVDKETSRIRGVLNQAMKDARELTNRIKSVANASEKIKLTQLRDKKNEEIANIKSKMKGKAKEVINFSRYVKDSIDMASQKYPSLDKSTISKIKNRYKALIHPNTTVKAAMAIMERMDKELHLTAFKSQENKADGLISRVLKMNKTKSKKSNIPVDTIHKLIETYQKFNEAKLEWDIFKMVQANQDLALFYKEGRDIFKENILNVKETIKWDVAQMVEQMDKEWVESLEMRTSNTPTSWFRRPKTLLENNLEFIESNTNAGLQVPRIFRWNKVMEEIFLGRFQKIQTRFMGIRRNIMDIHVPNAIAQAAKVFSSADDASVKLSLWMSSKSQFGHQNNLLTDVRFKKNSKGKYDVVFVTNWPKFDKKNKALIDSWDVIHFWKDWNNELKEKILQDIYTTLENEMKNNKEFAHAINEIKSHLKWTGDWLTEIMARRFNKVFVAMEDYFPMIKFGKWLDESGFTDAWAYWVVVKDTIEDSGLIARVEPAAGKMVQRELGFAETMNHHVNGMVYWQHNIEALLDADTTFRKLKQGRNWLVEEPPVSVLEDALNLEKIWDSEVWPDANPLMSPEVAFFLRTHIGKIATQWRNLSSWVDFGRPIVQKLTSYANRIILGTLKVAAKQTLSFPDIFIQAGLDNGATAIRSWNNRNLRYIYEVSGAVTERQRTWVSLEGKGKNNYLSTQLTKSQKIWQAWNETMDYINGNSTKVVDGALSSRAWMSWFSKYLDEQKLFHKAWEKLDIPTLHKKILSLPNWEAEWEEAVRAWDQMMNKIMGSNNLVEKAIGSESTLSKWSLLFQKTGLNHLISTYDSVINKLRDAKLEWKWVTTQTSIVALQTAKIVLGSAFLYWDSLAIDYLWKKWQAALNIIKEEDIGKIYDSFGHVIEDPTYNDIVWFHMKWYLSANVISPNAWLDLTTWLWPAINQYKKFTNAPTTWRKAEELVNVIWKVAINGSFEEVLRSWFARFWIGSTSVDAKEWDAAATQRINFYKENWLEPPTWDKLDNEVSAQIWINRRNMETNKWEKEEKKIQTTFVATALKKYWREITPQQYWAELKAHPEFLKTIEMKELESYYTKIQTLWAKTTWEKESLLMGKWMDVIFDVELRPLMEEGKAWDAFERLKELARKWVIKSDKWLMEAIKMMKEWQDANP